MDRGAWQATVHGVTKSWIQLKQLSTHIRNIHLVTELTKIYFSYIHLVLSTGPNFQLIKLLEFPKCETKMPLLCERGDF